MLIAFKQHIETHFPELTSKTLLIACSGGLDSAVLVHLCEACGLSYSIAHCNFGLRAAESSADEQFVADLAESLDRAFYVTSFNTRVYAKKQKLSIQMAARELRYQWFAAILEKQQIDFLLTAHHADDALETFLINLSRGTGIEGLTGIPARSNQVLRPLLAFSRKQILAYSKAQGIAWREDRSNKDVRYLRNKIRLEIIPPLKELNSRFIENFRRTQVQLSGTVSLLEQYRQLLREKWFQPMGDHIRIAVEPLAALQPADDYLYFLFSEYGFRDPREVAVLLRTGSGKLLISKTHRLIRDRDHLLLQPLQTFNTDTHAFPLEVGEIKEPIRISICEVPEIEERARHILYVDKETLNPVLSLRKWKKGDYFYPFGMKGRKKVSKFFKDEKVDLITKEQQWLLCSGNEIVWVVGLRPDERFKVQNTTKTILKLIWEI